MCFKIFKNTVLLLVLIVISCGLKTKEDAPQNTEITNPTEENNLTKNENNIIVGANRTKDYLPLLKGKRVGIVGNQSSVIFKDDQHTTNTHLVDSLLKLQINIVAVFSPEHGFRGTADAGELVKDGIDDKTGLPIISLYGDNKKPKLEKDSSKSDGAVDIVIFDLQDVGARFYTYISTLHYVMEACAEADIPLLILDRPNPNAHYVDGPVLEEAHKSYVGMHPIPVVHGMTIGEYAQMINGEAWLKNEVQCDLKIIPVKNYTHQTPYALPIKPSPNLPNATSINLYPSLCFFEGTNVSMGRGTSKQFQVVGSPYFELKSHHYTFTPQPNEGAKYPKHQNKVCSGYDLSQQQPLQALNLSWLIEFYKANKEHAPKESFFTDFFTLLAGTKTLQQQIEAGLSETEIKASWQKDLSDFKTLQKPYLIYE